MRYYQEHQSDYRSPATVTLRHIQLASEAEAKRVLPFARDPKKDFAELAKKYSADTLTRKNGGQLGTITRDGVFPTLGAQKTLADSAFALAEGQVGGPWKTDKGWHIIKLDQKHDETTRPVRAGEAADHPAAGRATHAGLLPRAARQGEARRRRARRFDRDQGLRERAAVGARAVPGRPAGHRSARARIAAYQRVVDEWPTSDVAAQSQFMIGFINSEELKDYDAAERAMRAVVKNYPKSDLVASAQWMIEHMRTDDVPEFITHSADSAGASPAGGAGPHPAPSPKTSKTTKP